MARDPALIQRVIRESTKERYNLIGDLNEWATEMKAKEVASSPEFLETFENLPPRSSILSKSSEKMHKLEDENLRKGKNKINALDYDAWEKFDVEKACEEMDVSETVELSEEEEIELLALKLRSKSLAAQKKELGNRYMKEKNYDAAVECYTKGIELDKSNSTLYANRAQAYIFKQNLIEAKKDCDEALKIDVNYVKVLYRRAKLNVQLGCIEEAQTDLHSAIKIEPNNQEVRNLLNDIKLKKRDSNAVPPTVKSVSSDFSRSILKAKGSKQSAVQNKSNVASTQMDEVFPPGNSYPKLIHSIEKPLQLRSKRPLFPLYVKVVGEKEDNAKIKRIRQEDSDVPKSSQCKESTQLEQLFSKMNFDNLPSKPTTAAQFEIHWKQTKASPEFFAHYLKQMTAEDYSIFKNAMESPMLTDIFDALIWEFLPKKWDIVPHMEGLLKVHRLGTLVMFMNEKDRANARKLVSLCPVEIQSHYLKWNI